MASKVVIKWNESTAESYCGRCRLRHRPRLGPSVFERGGCTLCEACSLVAAPRQFKKAQKQREAIEKRDARKLEDWVAASRT